MVQLICNGPGWGAVDDPETGDPVAVDEDVDLETARRLTGEYWAIEVDESTLDESAVDTDEVDRDLDDLTREELYETASELDISGRSDMDKAELIDAIRDAEDGGQE